MKFIILYGPPAVGKLTTAQELAKITGYKLFHNHLTVDVVKSLYDFGEPKFWKLVREMREMLIQSVAEDGVDTIFTFVYDAGQDDELIKKYISLIEVNHGEVLLVKLTTTPEILKERVTQESRKSFKKMTSPDSLDKWLTKYKLSESIPERQSLTIDNTKLSAQAVAMEIANHFNLPKSQGR